MIKEKIEEMRNELRATRFAGVDPAVLCGVMLDMLAIMEEMNKNQLQTANTASCLANGIQPD